MSEESSIESAPPNHHGLSDELAKKLIWKGGVAPATAAEIAEWNRARAESTSRRAAAMAAANASRLAERKVAEAEVAAVRQKQSQQARMENLSRRFLQRTPGAQRGQMLGHPRTIFALPAVRVKLTHIQDSIEAMGAAMLDPAGQWNSHACRVLEHVPQSFHTRLMLAQAVLGCAHIALHEASTALPSRVRVSALLDSHPLVDEAFAVDLV